MNSKLTIVMYHYVRPIKNSRYPEIKGLEYDFFKQQIDFLSANFNIVSPDEVCDAVTRKNPLPPNAVLLSFDDGYADHFNYVFPVLLNHGISGVFSMPAKILAERKVLDVNKIHFTLASADPAKIIADLKEQLNYYRGSEFEIPEFDELYAQYAVANRWDPAEVIFIKRILQTVLPERLRYLITEKLFKKFIPVSEDAFVSELYMTMEQIQTMTKCGMSFGIHGYDHKWLGNLAEDEMKQDIDKAIDFFNDVLPEKWCMCFPYGSANENAISYAAHKGATWGLSTEVRVADLEKDDPLFLPRFDTNDFPPKSQNYLKFN